MSHQFPQPFKALHEESTLVSAYPETDKAEKTDMARNKEEGQGDQQQPHSASDHDSQWSPLEDPSRFGHWGNKHKHNKTSSDFTWVSPTGFHVYRCQMPEYLSSALLSFLSEPGICTDSLVLWLHEYKHQPRPLWLTPIVTCMLGVSFCALAPSSLILITNLYCHACTHGKTPQSQEHMLTARVPQLPVCPVGPGTCCLPWPPPLHVCLQAAPVITQEPAAGPQTHISLTSATITVCLGP